MAEFNLIDEPWIGVQHRGEQRQLSIRDVFDEADEISALANDLPTIDFAILRVLLAIVHGAIGITTKSELARLRRHGLDLAAIHSYLDTWHPRFWLFHESAPFMQVHDLRTGKGEVAGLQMIIADLPNGHPFFTTRMGRGAQSITAAEAAAWLVHAQAFDAAGIRSGAVGDLLTKGGKGYPIGPAWSGQLGGIIVHGRHLAETLALNLVPIPHSDTDRPVWELTPQTEQRTDDAIPAGPLSLLTWQSRRVRLHGSVQGVTGVVLAQGDKMTPRNQQDLEAMSNWRYSNPQSKKFGVPTYMPQKHEADRSLWRALPAVLAPETITNVLKADSDAFIPAATLECAADHDSAATLRVQAVGITYGPQEATIEEVVNDSVDLRAALLGAESGQIRAMLQDSVAATNRAVWQLGTLAANIATASGERGDNAGEGARQRLEQRAWAALDSEARRWIASLSAEDDVEDAARRWQLAARPVLLDLARQEYTSAPPASLSGRPVRRGAVESFMTADIAFSIFRSGLAKELPLGAPESTTNQREES